MSNQIVITSGAKVRNLNGVLTGTAGVVDSVPLGGANGVATLDSSGKVPVSQLPASVVTYLGTWNAATNTPTLTNGVGDAGDMYLCNVAGTVDFGAGPISFNIGDWVLYGSGTWQKSNGQNGTVTSVDMTVPTGLAISGNPITTSGTLALSLASGYTIPTTSFLSGLVPYTGATGNVDLGTYGIKADYSQFNLTPSSVPTTVGTLSWDSEYRTLQLIDGDGDTTLQIGQEQRALIHNGTGSTLTDGQVVYVTGSTGQLPSVALASNTLESTSSVTFGVVTETIPHGSDGFVTISGMVNGLNTLAFNEGDAIYLGATAGTFTNVKPTAPANLVLIGYVIKKAGGNGSIFVKIQNGYELEELHDVSITSVANNEGIFWDSATSLWKNKTIAGALGYTPANDSLVVHKAGSETITGLKTFANDIIIDSGVSGNTLSFKQYSSGVTGGVGYTSLYAQGSDTLGINFGNIEEVLLSNSLLTTIRQYQFPDLSGTLALLEGSQTFTGSKTFDGYGIFNLSQLLKFNPTFPTTPAAGYLGVRAEQSGVINSLNLWDGTTYNTAKLSFDNTSSYTYTFPASSGTIALLEQGQTFTGSNTFSSTLISESGLVFKNGFYTVPSTGYTSIGGISNGLSIFTISGGINYTNNLQFGSSSNTFTFPASSGTIALTSNLSSYVPYTGATGSVDIGNNNYYGGTILLKQSAPSTSTTGYFSISGSTGTGTAGLVLGLGSGTTSSMAYPTSGNYTYTFPASSGTIALTSNIPTVSGASGQVTYFNGTSSVTGSNNFFWDATNNRLGIGLTNPQRALEIYSATADSHLRLSGSAPSVSLGEAITGSIYQAKFGLATANGQYASGAVAGDFVILSQTGATIFMTNATEKMRVNTSGRLLLGTTFDDLSSLLQVAGSAKFSGNATSSGIIVNNSNGATGTAQYYADFTASGGTVIGRILRGNGASGYEPNGLNIDNFAGMQIKLNTLGGSGGTFAVTGGAATFSSSVTATQGNFNAPSGTQENIIVKSANTGFSKIVIDAVTSASSQLAFLENGSQKGVAGYRPSTGNVFLANASADIININSSGNVGIGTSSPSAKLQIKQSTSNWYDGIRVFDGSSNTWTGIGNTGALAVVASSYDNTGSYLPLAFYTSDTERMRITSSGILMVGTTTVLGGGGAEATNGLNIGSSGVLVNNSTGDFNAYFAKRSGYSFGGLLGFYVAGSQVGSISTNGTTTSYNITSDYRLKQDFKGFNGLSIIDKIKTYDYEWKADNTRMYGVVAHELQSVLPYAVTGEKDGDQMQGVDYSKIVPILVKAVQEQQAQIEELKQLILNK